MKTIDLLDYLKAIEYISIRMKTVEWISNQTKNVSSNSLNYWFFENLTCYH